jgi:uncharacterized protein (UPF0248 family)
MNIPTYLRDELKKMMNLFWWHNKEKQKKYQITILKEIHNVGMSLFNYIYTLNKFRYVCKG